MIHIRDTWEIERIYKSCQIVKETLETLENFIKPGVTTIELDRIAEEYIRSKNAIPGFKGLYGFPSTICASIDEEVVHGIPSNRILKNGQILSLDVGAICDGYYGDHARSFAVGQITKDQQDLMNVTEESLYKGIDAAIPGNFIGDIGYAIQKHVESFGYGIVRDLVGHGIGEKLHEDPQIPNFGTKSTGPKIEIGMCFAIEPMVTLNSYEVFTKNDNWTIATKDGSFSAHFEHTITIDKNGPRILTK